MREQGSSASLAGRGPRSLITVSNGKVMFYE